MLAASVLNSLRRTWPQRIEVPILISGPCPYQMGYTGRLCENIRRPLAYRLYCPRYSGFKPPSPGFTRTLCYLLLLTAKRHNYRGTLSGNDGPRLVAVFLKEVDVIIVRQHQVVIYGPFSHSLLSKFESLLVEHDS